MRPPAPEGTEEALSLGWQPVPQAGPSWVPAGSAGISVSAFQPDLAPVTQPDPWVPWPPRHCPGQRGLTAGEDGAGAAAGVRPGDIGKEREVAEPAAPGRLGVRVREGPASCPPGDREGGAGLTRRERQPLFCPPTRTGARGGGGRRLAMRT